MALGSHSEEEKNYSYRNLMLMALGFGTVCSVAFHILTNEPENQKLEVRARYIRLINLIICRYNKPCTFSFIASEYLFIFYNR